MKQYGRQAVRQFLREWRAGELLAVAMALVTAVAAVTAVGGFAERISIGLGRSAGEVIASDIKLVGREPIPVMWEHRAAALGLKTAYTVTFPTVFFHQGQTLLASVKGVSAAYPLRGQLRSRGRSDQHDTTSKGGPEPGQLWVESRVLTGLELELGDTLALGSVSSNLESLLIYEPDRGQQFFSFSPRVMTTISDLERSGLLGPGSRARYALLAAGPIEQVEAFRAHAASQTGSQFRVVDIARAQSQVGTTLDKARNYIGLTSIGTLLIAGIAIAVAARRYVDRRRTQAALMRCFGATRHHVMLIHAQVLLLVGITWGLVGLLIGYLVQVLMASILGDTLGIELGPARMTSGLLGLSLGIVLLLGFSIPALMRLNRFAPLGVLRRVEEPSHGFLDRLWYAIPIVVLVMLARQQAGEYGLVVVVLLGIVATLVVMMVISRLVLALLRRAARGVGVSWRFGLGRLYRDPLSSTFQIAAIGLGLTVLVLLTLVRGQLFESWQGRIGPGAPNFFFANVQAHEKVAVGEFFESRLGVKLKFTPMATGRLTAIKGDVPDPEHYPDPRAASRIEGNTNFSWAKDLPAGNTLVQGQWWESNQIKPGVSLAKSWAEPLGVTVGDELGFRVGAETLEAVVTNIREVRWESLEPNFFILFPPQVFDNAPHSFLSAAFLDAPEEVVLTHFSRAFPTVNIIDIGAVLDQVRRIIAMVSLGLNLVFVFTLAAGAAVLFAVMQAGHDRRVRDAAMLKVLGCDRRRLRATLNAEFGVIAVLAGLIAAFTASMTGAFLAREIFDLDYFLDWRVLGVSICVSLMIVWVVSWSGVRSVLKSPPTIILRSR